MTLFRKYTTMEQEENFFVTCIIMIFNCVILARKNSKRIINKNLPNFKGKPLIY